MRIGLWPAHKIHGRAKGAWPIIIALRLLYHKPGRATTDCLDSRVNGAADTVPKALYSSVPMRKRPAPRGNPAHIPAVPKVERYIGPGQRPDAAVPYFPRRSAPDAPQSKKRASCRAAIKIHRHSRWYFRCALKALLQAAPQGAFDGLPLAWRMLLATRKRVYIFFERHLIRNLILF